MIDTQTFRAAFHSYFTRLLLSPCSVSRPPVYLNRPAQPAHTALSRHDIMAATSLPLALHVTFAVLLIISGSPATFGDGGYGSSGGSTCTASANLACTYRCGDRCGSAAKYSIPFGGTCNSSMRVESSTRPYCKTGCGLSECCQKCGQDRNCAYFQFSSSNNYCYIYRTAVAPPTCDSRASSSTSVGKKCGNGCNDPHFLGGHGTRFEFNGLPDSTFCLFTDRALHLNMRMRGYYDDRTIGASIIRGGKAVRTWIRELGFLWTDAETGAQHSFRLAARDGKETERGEGYIQTIEHDGKRLPLLKIGSFYDLPGGLRFSFNGYEKEGGGFFDVDAYTVQIAGRMTMDVKLRVAHPLLQTADDAQAHINVHFVDVQASPDVHGVMGQTYREGREQRAMQYSSLSLLLRHPFAADGLEGKGFLDGEVEDYRTSGVLKADCTYSAFGGRVLPPVQDVVGSEV
eukprot:TRINITY_DN299_c0_g1_i4.p2 TRINITY_DN299_c0_g1~~TRINITY_DN299_c0_g1_i4.p2  ORF type:complete len:458 (-),score=-7.78 TRINITY_DN299_c0_g1_i4:238-1611(-)